MPEITLRVIKDVGVLVDEGYAEAVGDMAMAVLVNECTNILNITEVEVDVGGYIDQIAAWAKEENKSIAEVLKADRYILAFVDNKLVGLTTLSFEKDVACDGLRLGNVFVMPEMRKQGIASAMLNHAIDLGNKLVVEHMSLNVVATDIAVQALYAKYGFKPVRVLMMRAMEGEEADETQDPD